MPRNTPVQSQERLNADLGIYAQDSFTLKRLTLNAGIRWEYLNSQVDIMTAPAGRFVPERTHAEIRDLPEWTDWAPRFQAVYDLFGNSKTAIKYSVNRYNAAQTVGVAAGFNALGLNAGTTTIAWTDLNGDNIPQGQRTWSADGKTFTDCVYQTPGCEIQVSALPANFGLLSEPGAYGGNPRSDGIEQGHALQHELIPRLSVTGSYYRGYNKNLTTTINRAVTPADYTKVPIFNAVDGSTIDFYDISAAAQSRATDNITILDPDRYSRYQSFAGEFRARMGRGAVLFGGVSWERELSNGTSATAGNCTIGKLQNPNQLRFCDRGNLPDGMSIPRRQWPPERQLSAAVAGDQRERLLSEQRWRRPGRQLRVLADDDVSDGDDAGCDRGRVPVTLRAGFDRFRESDGGKQYGATLPDGGGRVSQRAPEPDRLQDHQVVQGRQHSDLAGIRGVQPE